MTCGGGVDTRTFVVTTPVQYGGVPCEHEDGASGTEECNTQECPVDCDGSWSSWDTCSLTCGIGTQAKTFNINVPAQYGGATCSHPDGHVVDQSCATDACPVDCEGEWASWPQNP